MNTFWPWHWATLRKSHHLFTYLFLFIVYSFIYLPVCLFVCLFIVGGYPIQDCLFCLFVWLILCLIMFSRFIWTPKLTGSFCFSFSSDESTSMWYAVSEQNFTSYHHLKLHFHSFCLGCKYWRVLRLILVNCGYSKNSHISWTYQRKDRKQTRET